MSSEVTAEAVEAMRDDPEAWGEPQPEPERQRKSERRQRTEVVSVRFTPAELDTVLDRSEDAEMPVSTYLRKLALATAVPRTVNTEATREARPFWACRGYTFRRHGRYVILEGSGTPPVLDARLVRLLAADLDRVADEIEAEGGPDDAPQAPQRR